MFNTNEIIFFSSFIVFILTMLLVDLGVFQKHSHTLKFREALSWTLVWIGISVGFYFLIRYHGNLIHGTVSLEEIQHRIDRYNHPISIQGLGFEEAIKVYNENLSLEYLTGYLIEYSLSVDNIFVIILIFMSFKVEPQYYKRVLFWGIIGAVVMRFLFIFISSALIQRFEWLLYIFGAMLLFIGGKMGWEFLTGKQQQEVNTERHPVVLFMSKYFRVTKQNQGDKFWVMHKGKVFFTPLLIVLLIVEFSDVLFAVDSVPAVFSVTLDPYIVFFSNIFAILGLRSLFFLVMDIMNRFFYLKFGLAVLLSFVGLKMLLAHFYKLGTVESLVIIASIIAVSMIASQLRTMRLKKSE